MAVNRCATMRYMFSTYLPDELQQWLGQPFTKLYVFFCLVNMQFWKPNSFWWALLVRIGLLKFVWLSLPLFLKLFILHIYHHSQEWKLHLFLEVLAMEWSVFSESVLYWAGVTKVTLISHKVAQSLLRTRMRARALLYHSATSSQHSRWWSLFLYFPCSWWFLLQRMTVATLVNIFFHPYCWWNLCFGGRIAFKFCLGRIWHVNITAAQASAPAMDNYIIHVKPSLSILSLSSEFSLSWLNFTLLILLALSGF